MDEDEINALLDETNQHEPIADLLDEEWDEYVDKNLSVQDQLEKAFMLTQNIVDGWWNNDDVDKITTKDAVRSTSVGDKIHINDTSYWVDMVGFKEDK